MHAQGGAQFYEYVFFAPIPCHRLLVLGNRNRDGLIIIIVATKASRVLFVET